MVLNWSKVLCALNESPGCVSEEHHQKFLNVILSPRIYMKSDGFYLDNNVGPEEVFIQDTKLEHYSELHKYALMQSKFWWNKCPSNYENIPNARELVMSKYVYMTEEVCNKLDNMRRFYNYM